MQRPQNRPAFTIIELLVVISIIAALIALIMPAVAGARDTARLTLSTSNLRNLAVANASYAAQFADRQFTLVDDGISRYGTGVTAFDEFRRSTGRAHPPAVVGWGYRYNDPNADYVLFGYATHDSQVGAFESANAGMLLPINFAGAMKYFGSFRMANVQQFSQFMSGRFYDPVFYAPKDRVAMDAITTGGFEGGNCFDVPGEYCDRPPTDHGDVPVWSSYCFSPAAMLNPYVMARHGWRDPWTVDGGFRSPAMSQAAYPSLKTHMLEHAWLQNRRAECNPAFVGANADGCEPYYFNHSWRSTPATLFYDGHVSITGVQDAMAADSSIRKQGGTGLWLRDTSWRRDGYLTRAGYDQAETSYHILTSDGIRGRDFTSSP
ncbi:MAG: type II secretion system protein [Planctomycetota bacterium]|jgi:prepilin-type N-terminal cleavage/methylation domain-containing protein